jgi:hypothetical protein
MNRFIFALSLFAISACAIPVRVVNLEPEPATAARHIFAMGTPGGAEYRYCLPTVPAVTGNNTSVLIFDTTAGGTVSGVYKFLQRVMVSGQFNQAVTMNYQVQHVGSATWVNAAGSTLGDAFAANTETEVDYLSQGVESRLSVATGGAGPTTQRVDVCLFFVRNVGQ